MRVPRRGSAIPHSLRLVLVLMCHAALVKVAMKPEGMRLMRGALRLVRSRIPVRMGSLRRVAPVSRIFGYDRGQPVDRFYVERFLADNASVIAGRVMEIGDSTYTRRFGGQRVTAIDVLNIDDTFPETTIVGDLADADQIPSDTFDCLVITQTLHLIYDLSAAVATLHRILRPGGTLLLTVPGITSLSDDRWAETWYWALTPLSARRLFSDVFTQENVEVSAHGNVLTSVAFLEGLASRELRPRELAVDDPQYPMLITVKATKR
jgi:SAM-dependent methyltransferase